MAVLTRVVEHSLRNAIAGVTLRCMSTQQSQGYNNDVSDDKDFRVLNLRSTKENVTRRRTVRKEIVQPPRSNRMAVDQDWTAVWPGPRSFHPASVPLTVRQGYKLKGQAPPSKYANAELMKIPNFLHLTPRAIQQQCQAIKRFCTPWPKALATEAQMHSKFPVQVTHTDYCQSLPTIRNIEARRVSVKLPLSNLKFDFHARDKFLRLVGERYDRETDVLTIEADRCPLRKQNFDYALYLLTACYHESFVTEPWEATKSETDMEYYHFDRNASRIAVENIINWGNEEKLPVNREFANCVETLINEGENEENLLNYKENVLKTLAIKTKQ